MKFIATGRVHPERADISFSQIRFDAAADGEVLAFCQSSQLTVVLDLSTIRDHTEAYWAAEHYAYQIVASLGFSLGSGYSVEVIKVIDANGLPHVFGVRPGGLQFDPYLPVFRSALELAAENVFFRLALRDYVRAITDQTDCALYCYRAIESIKSAFAFEGVDDAWRSMHEALGTNRERIENEVKRFADPVRHGNWVEAQNTTGGSRIRILACTRDVLTRFLSHAKPATSISFAQNIE